APRGVDLPEGAHDVHRGRGRRGTLPHGRDDPLPPARVRLARRNRPGADLTARTETKDASTMLVVQAIGDLVPDGRFSRALPSPTRPNGGRLLRSAAAASWCSASRSSATPTRRRLRRLPSRSSWPLRRAHPSTPPAPPQPAGGSVPGRG